MAQEGWSPLALPRDHLVLGTLQEDYIYNVNGHWEWCQKGLVTITTVVDAPFRSFSHSQSAITGTDKAAFLHKSHPCGIFYTHCCCTHSWCESTDMGSVIICVFSHTGNNLCEKLMPGWLWGSKIYNRMFLATDVLSVQESGYVNQCSAFVLSCCSHQLCSAKSCNDWLGDWHQYYCCLCDLSTQGLPHLYYVHYSTGVATAEDIVGKTSTINCTTWSGSPPIATLCVVSGGM